MLHEVFGAFDTVITLEDGCVLGGMGSAVVEFMAENGYQAQVRRLGMPDRVVEHGSQAQLYAECGYDAAAVVETAEALLAAKAARTARGLYTA
jgi:1-deoxy-D-xylulose-5-phosphate synthase